MIHLKIKVELEIEMIYLYFLKNKNPHISYANLSYVETHCREVLKYLRFSCYKEALLRTHVRNFWSDPSSENIKCWSIYKITLLGMIFRIGWHEKINSYCVCLQFYQKYDWAFILEILKCKIFCIEAKPLLGVFNIRTTNFIAKFIEQGHSQCSHIHIHIR